MYEKLLHFPVIYFFHHYVGGGGRLERWFCDSQKKVERVSFRKMWMRNTMSKPRGWTSESSNVQLVNNKKIAKKGLTRFFVFFGVITESIKPGGDSFGRHFFYENVRRDMNNNETLYFHTECVCFYRTCFFSVELRSECDHHISFCDLS